MLLIVQWGWGPAWIQGQLHYSWRDVIIVILVAEFVRYSWSFPPWVVTAFSILRSGSGR